MKMCGCPFTRTAHGNADSRGFTLVELLVVIAILGVLLALVALPAGRMFQRARSAHSISNLRQIGQMTFLYARENQMKIPHVNWEAHVRHHMWLNALYPLAYGGEPFPGFEPFDTGANLRRTIFYSPNMSRAEGAPYRSYGWNAMLMRWAPPPDDGTRIDIRRRLTEIRNPSQTAMCGDIRNSSSLVVGNVNHRNAGLANILFADGRVESLSPQQIPRDSSDPQFVDFWYRY